MANGTKLQQQTSSYNQSFERALESARNFNKKLDVLAQSIEALRKEKARRYEFVMQEDCRKHEQLLDSIRSHSMCDKRSEIRERGTVEGFGPLPTLKAAKGGDSSLTNAETHSKTEMRKLEQKHYEDLKMKVYNMSDEELWSRVERPEKLLRLHATQLSPTKPILAIAAPYTEDRSSKGSNVEDNIIPFTHRANQDEGPSPGIHKLQEMEEERPPQWHSNDPLPQQPRSDQFHSQQQQHKLQDRSMGRGTEPHCSHSILRSNSSLKVASQFGAKYSLDRLLVTPQSSLQPTTSSRLQSAMDATQAELLRSKCYSGRFATKIGLLQTKKAKLEKQVIDNYKDKPPWKEIVVDRWKRIDIICLTEDTGEWFCRRIHEKAEEDFQAKPEDFKVQGLTQHSSLVEACIVCRFVRGYNKLRSMLERPHPCSLSLPYEQAKLLESNGELGVNLTCTQERKAGHLQLLHQHGCKTMQDRDEEDHLPTKLHATVIWQIRNKFDQFNSWQGVGRYMQQLAQDYGSCLRVTEEYYVHQRRSKEVFEMGEQVYLKLLLCEQSIKALERYLRATINQFGLDHISKQTTTACRLQPSEGPEGEPSPVQELPSMSLTGEVGREWKTPQIGTRRHKTGYFRTQFKSSILEDKDDIKEEGL